MKKLVVVVAVVVVALTSCKKSYKCECTTGGVTISGGTFKATKADAEKSCNITTTSSSCKAVRA